jgi:uncharacterized protein (TIGR00106 family)
MARNKGYRVIAEFSIHPVGEGTSVSRYVRAALAELRKYRGLRLQVTPMATVIEAKNLSEIMAAVAAAHETLFKLGAKRVDFTLRVDDRRDKKRQMEDKVRSALEEHSTNHG